MNLYEPAIKLRQIANDIFNVAESLSPIQDGTLLHTDAVDVTAVIVKSVLIALVQDNPSANLLDYRNAFVEKLDHLCCVGEGVPK